MREQPAPSSVWFPRGTRFRKAGLSEYVRREGCEFCGAIACGCGPSWWVTCRACGACVCSAACRGAGTCPICFTGLMDGYRQAERCGYKGCTEPPICTAPRVGRACRAHAVAKGFLRAPDPEFLRWVRV